MKGGPKSDWPSIIADPDMMLEIDLEHRDDKILATITLASEPADPSKSQNSVCAILPADTTATVNGQAIRKVNLGRWGGYFCEVSQWEIADAAPVLAQSSLKIRLANSTGALEGEFINVGTPRSFEIVSPVGGVAHPGDSITVKLSPQRDRFDSFSTVRMDFNNGEPSVPAPPTWLDFQNSPEPLDYAFAYPQGRMATFKVPEKAVGATVVRLSVDAHVGVAHCHVKRCELEVYEMTNAVALRIEP